MWLPSTHSSNTNGPVPMGFWPASSPSSATAAALVMPAPGAARSMSASGAGFEKTSSTV